MKIEIRKDVITKIEELRESYGIELTLEGFIEDILIREYEEEL